MAGDSRARMIDSAVALLATRGLQATSFSEVLEHSGAPRGSVYHHFPGGKDELVGAAVDLAGERAILTLEAHEGESARAIAELFIGMWRALLTATQFRAGCSVAAVTVAADDAHQLDRAGAVFRAWRATLARLLAAGGAEHPERSAAALIAGCEGAVIMARAERSIEPFELAAADLLERI